MELTTSVLVWSAITILGAAVLPIVVIVWSIYRYGTPPDANPKDAQKDT